jgi:putative flippase GtrA
VTRVPERDGDGRSFLRFLLAGAANTLGTLAVYFLLLYVLPPFPAWALAFATGIAFVSVVYPRFVFRTRGTAAGVAGNAVYYLFSFLLSEGLLSVAIHWLDLDARLAGVAVAAIMVPINFLAARYFFARPNRP